MPRALSIQYLAVEFTLPSTPANKPPSRFKPPGEARALETSPSAATSASSRKVLLLIANCHRDGTRRNLSRSFYSLGAVLNWHLRSAPFLVEIRLGVWELNSVCNCFIFWCTCRVARENWSTNCPCDPTRPQVNSTNRLREGR